MDLECIQQLRRELTDTMRNLGDGMRSEIAKQINDCLQKDFARLSRQFRDELSYRPHVGGSSELVLPTASQEQDLPGRHVWRHQHIRPFQFDLYAQHVQHSGLVGLPEHGDEDVYVSERRYSSESSRFQSRTPLLSDIAPSPEVPTGRGWLRKSYSMVAENGDFPSQRQDDDVSLDDDAEVVCQKHKNGESPTSCIPDDGVPLAPGEPLLPHLTLSLGQPRELFAESNDGEKDSLIPVKRTKAKGPKKETDWSRFLCKLKTIIESSLFELMSSGFVASNAILLGLETDYRARHVHEQAGHLPHTYAVAEKAFCLIFVLELVVRLLVYQWHYFTMRGFHWNIFDFVLVVLQVVEEITRLLFNASHSTNVAALRMLRILRLLRLTRILRVVRSAEGLRTIVASIIGSLPSLAWILLLLGGLTYVVAICITQLVAERHVAGSGRLGNDVPDVERLFGNVQSASITLVKSVWHGIEWGEVLDILAETCSPMVAFVFFCYVTFTVLAVINIVTAVFIETSSRVAEKDHEEHLATHLIDIFKFADADTSGEISWEEFQAKLHTEEMLTYFKEIDVSGSEARALFDLLDKDGSGSIDLVEFVSGCLSLHGPAKALTLAYHVYETNKIHDWMMDHMARLESIALKTMSILSPDSGNHSPRSDPYQGDKSKDERDE